MHIVGFVRLLGQFGRLRLRGYATYVQTYLSFCIMSYFVLYTIIVQQTKPAGKKKAVSK